MSTPAENLNTPATDAGMQGLPGEDLSWITTTGIDVPAEGESAPLPTDAATGADKGAEGTDKTLAPGTVEAPPKVDDVKVDAATAAEEVKPDVEAKAEDVEEGLGEEDSKLVQSLSAEQQALVVPRIKRAFFMDHFKNPDKDMAGIVDHLASRSASRFGAMESVILERNLAKPQELAAKVFNSSRETYSKLANAIFDGDKKYFTSKVLGRDDLTPDEVKARLEFYDAHKDAKFEATTKLSELDEETIKEIEEYHGPEKAAAIREALEIAQKAKTAEAAAADKPAVVEDADKTARAAAEQQAAVVKEINDLWDEGRNVIGSYASTLAYDPKTGIGINVTPEERAASPLVARLKDIKAGLFFDGFEVEGKEVLPSFDSGINTWGKERPAFVEKIVHMDKFTQAREKQNVLEVANSAKPLAKLYYDDRLKHPVFKEIDDIIALVAAQGKTAPKLDIDIPGALPSPKGSGTAGAGDGDWLVQDAVKRVAGA